MKVEVAELGEAEVVVEVVARLIVLVAEKTVAVDVDVDVAVAVAECEFGADLWVVLILIPKSVYDLYKNLQRREGKRAYLLAASNMACLRACRLCFLSCGLLAKESEYFVNTPAQS